MRFFSDNAAPVHPAVLRAIAAADELDTAYDGDRWSKRLDARFSDLFGREVAALWMPTGTVANAIALATICQPYGGVICHIEAHIQNDECGAPEFYTHGAKLLLAEGDDAGTLARELFPDADADGDADADADTLGAAVALTLTLGSDVAPMPRSVASSRLSSATWAPRASAASRRWFVSWLAALIATTR